MVLQSTCYHLCNPWGVTQNVCYPGFRKCYRVCTRWGVTQNFCYPGFRKCYRVCNRWSVTQNFCYPGFRKCYRVCNRWGVTQNCCYPGFGKCYRVCNRWEFLLPSSNRAEKKHSKAWWSGLHFHCLHPRQKRVPLCLQPLPRLLLTGPPPRPLVLVPLLPPHLGPLTLLAVTAAGCTAKLITWVHIPDLVVLPLVPLQPLLLFLEDPNQTWTPLARQFQWGWALVGGPQMQHDPNVAPGLNNPGIQVFLAEFRQVLGPQLQ